MATEKMAESGSRRLQDEKSCNPKKKKQKTETMEEILAVTHCKTDKPGQTSVGAGQCSSIES